MTISANTTRHSSIPTGSELSVEFFYAFHLIESVRDELTLAFVDDSLDGQALEDAILVRSIKEHNDDDSFYVNCLDQLTIDQIVLLIKEACRKA